MALGFVDSLHRQNVPPSVAEQVTALTLELVWPGLELAKQVLGMFCNSHLCPWAVGGSNKVLRVKLKRTCLVLNNCFKKPLFRLLMADSNFPGGSEGEDLPAVQEG